MTFLDIPYLNNYKSVIAGYGLLVSGISALLMVVANCLQGGITIMECYYAFQDSLLPIMAALNGLGIIGIAHKVEKKS